MKTYLPLLFIVLAGIQPALAIELSYQDTVVHCLENKRINLDSLSTHIGGKQQWSGKGVVQQNGTYFFDKSRAGNDKKLYQVLLKVGAADQGNGVVTRDTFYIKVEDCSTSSGQKNPGDGFAIYPNPSHREVLLSHNEAFSYKVYNMSGVLIDKSKENVTQARLLLKEGTYWIVLYSENGDMKSQRVVVTR